MVGMIIKICFSTSIIKYNNVGTTISITALNYVRMQFDKEHRLTLNLYIQVEHV